jgi:hypothetical protein
MQNKNVIIVNDGSASSATVIGMNRKRRCVMKDIHAKRIVFGK